MAVGKKEQRRRLRQAKAWPMAFGKTAAEYKQALAQPAGKLVWSPELNRMILVPEKP